MKSSRLFALVAAALLSGCATHHHHQQCLCSVDLVHMNPQITVRSDTISVSPDPLVFERNEKDFRIVWRLTQPDLVFPRNGIVIDGELVDSESKREIRPGPNRASAIKKGVLREQNEITDCRPSEDARSFSCLNRHTRPGVYRYTMRVLRKGEPLQSDPTMMND